MARALSTYNLTRRSPLPFGAGGGFNRAVRRAALDALKGWVLDVVVSIAVMYPTVIYFLCSQHQRTNSGIAIRYSRQMSVDDDYETSKAM